MTETLHDRALREPLEIDISDYSDEYCAGFLAGQVNTINFQRKQVYMSVLNDLQPFIDSLHQLPAQPTDSRIAGAVSTDGNERYVFGIDAAGREFGLRFTPEELDRVIGQLQELRGQP